MFGHLKVTFGQNSREMGEGNRGTGGGQERKKGERNRLFLFQIYSVKIRLAS